MMISYKMTGAFSRISTNNEYGYKEGIVVTPLGIVWVYSQGGNNPYATLETVFSGKVFTEHLKKEYTTRGLAIMGHKFIKRVQKGTV